MLVIKNHQQKVHSILQSLTILPQIKECSVNPITTFTQSNNFFYNLIELDAGNEIQFYTTAISSMDPFPPNPCNSVIAPPVIFVSGHVARLSGIVSRFEL